MSSPEKFGLYTYIDGVNVHCIKDLRIAVKGILVKRYFSINENEKISVL